MPPKLLAVDLDGTLCRKDGLVDDRDQAALRAAVDAGVTVALVTGRLIAGTLPVARSLGLDGFHACADGAVIVECPSGALREHVTLPWDTRDRLRELLASVDGPSFLLSDAAVLHDPPGEPHLSYLAIWSPDLRAVPSVLDDPLWDGIGPTQTVTVGPREQVDRVVATLQAETTLELLHFDASPYPDRAVLVTRPPGESKGTAITRLAALAGCTLADVVAVGDWLNDVPMFRVAGRSFAVPGCPESLRVLATDLLEAPGGHGAVAEAIDRTWGLRY